MARPVKRGLSYYPKDIDFYDDLKIMKLLGEYGPLGVTVYEIMLCYIYRDNGYYLAVPLDELAAQIVRKIGNRWVKKNDLVLQVMHRCVEIGLFDEGLLTKGIITSAGIQKRYAEVTARSKADKSLYWLLDDKPGQPGSSIPSFEVKASETEVFAAETPVSAKQMHQTKENKTKLKQTKENKIKLNESKAEQSKAKAPEVQRAAGCAAYANEDEFLYSFADTAEADQYPEPCTAEAHADELSQVHAERADTDEAHRAFEQIKHPTPQELERIDRLSVRYGEQAVIAAMSDAARKGGRSLAYVERILEDIDDRSSPQWHDRPPFDPDAYTPPPRRHDPYCYDSGFDAEEVERMMYDEWFGDEL